MEYRTCFGCNTLFPFTDEYFTKDSHKSSGLKTRCKSCSIIDSKRYRENHPNATKIYYENNKEKVSERNKKWKQTENGKQSAKKYREQNRDKNLSRMAEYRETHREELRKKANEYYYKNYDACKERASDYRKRTQPIKNIQTQHYRARKKSLICTLTKDEWEYIKQSFNGKCAYCGKESRLCQDHFVPITLGGHYAIYNIIPCCRSCNSSKHDKPFSEWYPQYKHYSKERETKVLTFIEKQFNKQDTLEK